MKKRFHAGQVTFLCFKKFKESNKNWLKMVFLKTIKASSIQTKKWNMWDQKWKDYANLWMNNMNLMFKDWKSREMNKENKRKSKVCCKSKIKIIRVQINIWLIKLKWEDNFWINKLKCFNKSNLILLKINIIKGLVLKCSCKVFNFRIRWNISKS